MIEKTSIKKKYLIVSLEALLLSGHSNVSCDIYSLPYMLILIIQFMRLYIYVNTSFKNVLLFGGRGDGCCANAYYTTENNCSSQ